MRELIRKSALYRAYLFTRDMLRWRRRGYAAPSPDFIKHQCLRRNGFPNATWVETGTFLGRTTEMLAKSAKLVYSIEPEPSLYEKAANRLAELSNVQILNGTSEALFPSLLGELSGPVNFWLDGHYSAGATYQAEQDTPIREELAAIEANRENLSSIVVLVDDVRCFDPTRPEYTAYPSIDFLVDWAHSNDLLWHIEHDIFVAKTKDAAVVSNG